MEFAILNVIHNWAADRIASGKYNPKYSDALTKLCEAIEAVNKFH